MREIQIKTFLIWAKDLMENSTIKDIHVFGSRRLELEKELCFRTDIPIISYGNSTVNHLLKATTDPLSVVAFVGCLKNLKPQVFVFSYGSSR